MRFYLILASTLLFLVFFSSCQKEVEYSAENLFTKLTDLKGTWQLSPSKTGFEQWDLQESSLIGTGYNIVNADTLLSELYAIEIIGDSISFQVTLINNSIPSKTMYYGVSDANENQITFYNPTRDFPKSLTYDFTNDDEILITRKGIIVDSEQTMTETLKKIN